MQSARISLCVMWPCVFGGAALRLQLSMKRRECASVRALSERQEQQMQALAAQMSEAAASRHHLSEVWRDQDQLAEEAAWAHEKVCPRVASCLAI